MKNSTEELEWCLTREISTSGDIQFIENKRAVIKAMLPILRLVSDPTRLDHYIQKMSVLMRVRSESLYESLKKVTSQPAVWAPAKISAYSLTNEEQLLSIFLSEPALFEEYKKEFEEIVWQSVDAQSIAKAVVNCYNDKALVKNQVQFLSRTKTYLDSRVSEKIDLWQFWLSQTWPNLSSQTAKELLDEKISRLSSKHHEKDKENLADAIRLAQEKGDIKTVKELMTKLTKMSKEDKKDD
jgi:hypothetical protein